MDQLTYLLFLKNISLWPKWTSSVSLNFVLRHYVRFFINACCKSFKSACGFSCGFGCRSRFPCCSGFFLRDNDIRFLFTSTSRTVAMTFWWTLPGEEGECTAKQKEQRTSGPEKKSLSGLLYCICTMLPCERRLPFLYPSS